MLPSVASLAVTAKRILLYTLLLWSVSLLFVPIGQMGVIYLVAAVVLGAIFTAMAIQLTRETTTAVAMRLFSWSITYVALLFGGANTFANTPSGSTSYPRTGRRTHLFCHSPKADSALSSSAVIRTAAP